MVKKVLLTLSGPIIVRNWLAFMVVCPPVPVKVRFTARPALSLEETAMPVRFPTLTPFEARIFCISDSPMETCQFE